jgi:hypothetical protein
LFLGAASGQISFSLSGSFTNKTLNIGKGINGKLTLAVQTDGNQAAASAGVRAKEGDKLSFDSNGLTKTAGYWQGLNNSTYSIRLTSPQKTFPATETSPSANDQMWVAYSPEGKTILTRGPGGPEIMPLMLQLIERPRGLMGAAAILVVHGDVQWYEDGSIYGKENLLKISSDGSHFSTITDCLVKDGSLSITSEDGSKYKVYALSYDFSATVERIPN